MFLGEGLQFLREALRYPHLLREVVLTARALREAGELLEEAASVGIKLLRVSEEIMALLTDTVTPQGLVTVCSLVHKEFPSPDPCEGPLVFLDQLRDPGNVGTLIRAADASGMGGVLISKRSADPYNPKAVRASAGSLLNIPLYLGLEPREALVFLRSQGYRVVAAHPGATEVFWDHPWIEDTVIMVGNEAWGIPEEDLELADAEVSIPIFGKAESLNAAAAAALIFYEIRRRFPAASGKSGGVAR